MIGENFPYTNFHDMNLDWMIKIAKDFLDQYTSIQQIISDGETALTEKTETGLADLQDKYDTLEGLLDAWYTEHSEDIADELAEALGDLNDWYTEHSGYLDQYLTDSIAAFNTAADTKAAETIASIPDDYTAVAQETSGMHNAITEYKFFGWVLGSINDGDGSDVVSTTRIRSAYLMLPKGTIISVMGGCNIVVYGYTRSKAARSYIQNTWTANDVTTDETGYYRIVVRNSTNSTITEAEIPDVAKNVFIKYVNYQNITPGKNIVPLWNNGSGGIYIDGTAIKMKERGFGIIIDGFNYYIASTDHSTEYTFTKDNNENYPYFLVLDTENLNQGSRTDPSDCMSVIDIYTLNSSYKPTMVMIAELYINNWDFISPFDYFAYKMENTAPICKQLAENHLIKHMANTESVFDSALSDHYEIMECDLRFTSDGVGVLNHDATMSNGGSTYSIALETYATLKAIFPSLLKLDEFLIMCKLHNITAEIDLTGISANATQRSYVVNDILKTGMIGRSFITCVGSDARYFRDLNKNLIICISGITTTDDIADCMDIITRVRLCIISIVHNVITKAMIEAAHSKGALIKTWTVNNTTEANTVFGNGCDLIITDDITP